MKRLAIRATILCSYLLLGLGILTGCATTVPVDTSSSATAPVITWVITQTGDSTVHTLNANAQFSIKLGVKYYVSMHAKSPSGVKTITVMGEEGWTCLNGNLGQNQDGELAPQTVNQTAKNGQAEDELFSFQALGLSDSPCNSGYTFLSGGIGLDGTAANFANEQSTGHLAMTVAP
jgi:osmotically-inducible protein OsmY